MTNNTDPRRAQGGNFDDFDEVETFVEYEELEKKRPESVARPDYAKNTYNELYQQAKDIGIQGYTNMTKQQLINALRSH